MTDARLNKILGRNLRKHRASLEQPRQIFAAAYGGSAYTPQSYEAGQKCPNLARFLTLCNTFSLSPNALMDGLFPWRSELEDIRELEALASGLHGHQAQKLRDLQNIYLRNTLETRPRLIGAPFGTRLRILRLKSDTAIDLLAETCTVSKPTMQGYESGQYDPPLPVVLRLCETFGVSPEYLLAPRLQTLTYADARIADLRPKQIKTLLELSRYFRNDL